MNLFQGVHEVRLFRPNGIAVGYFTEWDAALRAIENEPSQYKAAYFTINPIKLPDGIPLNPASLNPSRAAASDTDIERRVWLLIDLDPPRVAGTNATEVEKRGAREQAERVREYLASRHWPAPLLADSGNGWHLLYRVDLPNDAASCGLVRNVLARLKQLFPMVDLGNFNASRLAKLYGTWARKGEHTEERPWRRSGIAEDCNGTVVTEAQLRDLVPAKLTVTPHSNNPKLEQLLGFLDYYGVPLRSEPREVSGGWQIEISCPWEDEHSGETRRDTVVSFIAGLGNGFRCMHAHCATRQWRDFRAELEKRNPGLAPYFRRLPLMTHRAIARQFVQEHEGFVRVYDADNATGVWIEGTRWQLGDKGDALLRMEIARYLDELCTRYPEPEDGKKDYRLALQQAPFTTGVLTEAKPWLPPKSIRDFDASPEILPLPNGTVADLKQGRIRAMQREDCQTKRIKVMPANVPTPRWDRFLHEVTNGDKELADFIVRLCALAISGLSLHVLVFLEGAGRNGKGCLCRVIEHILGEGIFAATIKPADVEYQRGASERDKRTMGKLRGMRFCYTGETVGGNLDWTLCKVLTGGDTLTGAKLYQDETGFKPSHTLLLLTNDRPKLPPTTAFKGRLVYVPFRVDFSNRVDLTLEDDLRREAPGILWKLVQVAPRIFEQGLEPRPACVRDATEDLIDENDVARPYIEQRLIEDADAVTQLPTIEADIIKWRNRGMLIQDSEVERILQGVRVRWPLGRKRVPGKPYPVRGLLGVRLRESSS